MSTAPREFFALHLDRQALRALRALVRASIHGKPAPSRSRSQFDALRSLAEAQRVTRKKFTRATPRYEQRDEISGQGLRVFRDVSGSVVVETLVRRGSTWVPNPLPVWVIAPEILADVRALLRGAAPSTRARRRGGRAARGRAQAVR